MAQTESVSAPHSPSRHREASGGVKGTGSQGASGSATVSAAGTIGSTAAGTASSARAMVPLHIAELKRQCSGGGSGRSLLDPLTSGRHGASSSSGSGGGRLMVLTWGRLTSDEASGSAGAHCTTESLTRQRTHVDILRNSVRNLIQGGLPAGPSRRDLTAGGAALVAGGSASVLAEIAANANANANSGGGCQLTIDSR